MHRLGLHLNALLPKILANLRQEPIQLRVIDHGDTIYDDDVVEPLVQVDFVSG